MKNGLTIPIILLVFLGTPELLPGPHASQSLEQEITGADGAPMVLIPAGEFLMGNHNSRDRQEKPDIR